MEVAKLRRWLLVAAGAVLLLIAGGGIAYASIPGPDGTINGCYKTSTGVLSVIDSSSTCPSGSTSLNWNQTGPQGPAGPSTGGSAGLDLQIIRSVGASGVAATATCPADHPFLYGGGGLDEQGGPLPGLPDGGPASSVSESTSGSQFYEVPPPGGSPGDTPVAYAICGK